MNVHKYGTFWFSILAFFCFCFCLFINLNQMVVDSHFSSYFLYKCRIQIQYFITLFAMHNAVPSILVQFTQVIPMHCCLAIRWPGQSFIFNKLKWIHNSEIYFFFCIILFCFIHNLIIKNKVAWSCATNSISCF